MSQHNHYQLQEENDIPMGIPVDQHSFQNSHPSVNYTIQSNQIPYQSHSIQHGQLSQHPQMVQPPFQPPRNNPPYQIPQQQQNLQLGNQAKFNFPYETTCPSCKLRVTTIVNKEPGNTTYAWVGACCILIGPPCCLIPFFVEGCLDKNHYCPKCGFNILRKHQSFCEFCS